LSEGEFRERGYLADAAVLQLRQLTDSLLTIDDETVRRDEVL